MNVEEMLKASIDGSGERDKCDLNTFTARKGPTFRWSW